MAATFNPAADDFTSDDLGPRRTSILAIIALVLSLICILPGAGLLGAIFGLAALIGISQSRGRVGGTGLAIAGLLLGLVFTALQVAVLIGALQAKKFFEIQMIGPANATMTAIEAGDYNAARTHFVPEMAAVITDEQFEKFREAYRVEMGSFKTIPLGFIDFCVAYPKVEGTMKGMGSNNSSMQNALPTPAEFDKGWTLTIAEFKPDSSRSPKGGSKVIMPFVNVAVVSQDGKKTIWLVERSGTQIPPTPVPPPAPTEKGPDQTPEPAPGDGAGGGGAKEPGGS